MIKTEKAGVLCLLSLNLNPNNMKKRVSKK